MAVTTFSQSFKFVVIFLVQANEDRAVVFQTIQYIVMIHLHEIFLGNNWELLEIPDT